MHKVTRKRSIFTLSTAIANQSLYSMSSPLHGGVEPFLVWDQPLCTVGKEELRDCLSVCLSVCLYVTVSGSIFHFICLINALK